MKIAVIPNIMKDADFKIVMRCIDALTKYSEVFLPDQYKTLFAKTKYLAEEELYKACSIIITLGGDGTLMESMRRAAPYGNCVLGLNLGRMGFLTGAEVDSFFDMEFDKLTDKNCVQERMMLKAEMMRGTEVVGSYLAVNDVVITCEAYSHIISASVKADDEYIDTYRGDGVVISTPTGSTAYSLSAGGPIVSPDVEAIIVTPICPHMLSTRPLIISPNKKMTVEICTGEKHSSAVTVDGQEGIRLLAGDKILISKAECKARLLMLHGNGFFEVLRNKLQGAGK